MKIFISWSGKKSRETAEILKDWLPQVIQAVEPWMSPDIEKGKAWREEIKNKLEEIGFGIVCLTRDNLQSEWLLFEAGALSKTKDAQVCTFLLDLKPTDVKDPLALYQATEFKKEDVFKLIKDINKKLEVLGSKFLSESVILKVFEKNWEDLNSKLNEASNVNVSDDTELIRTDRELLEEILDNIRSKNRPFFNNYDFNINENVLPKFYILLDKATNSETLKILKNYLRSHNYPILKENIEKVKDYTVYIFYTDNYYDIEELEIVLNNSNFNMSGVGYFSNIKNVLAH